MPMHRVVGLPIVAPARRLARAISRPPDPWPLGVLSFASCLASKVEFAFFPELNAMNQPIASKYLRRELPTALLDDLKAVLGA